MLGVHCVIRHHLSVCGYDDDDKLMSLGLLFILYRKEFLIVQKQERHIHTHKSYLLTAQVCQPSVAEAISGLILTELDFEMLFNQ